MHVRLSFALTTGCSLFENKFINMLKYRSGARTIQIFIINGHLQFIHRDPAGNHLVHKTKN